MKITAPTPNSVLLTALRESKSAATQAEDAQDKRLKNMQEGLQRLKEMPSPQKMAKQQAQNKVGALQRRLDALKMMLLNATPEQAKALARQLKDIAGQMASAAKSAGSASTPGQAVPSGAENLAVAAETEAASAASAETRSGIAVEAALSREKQEDGQAESAREQITVSNAPQSAGNEAEIDDAVLRGLLLDAKKLLKEVIDMLKPKLASAGKEAKDDLKEAEKQLAEMDQAMQQNQPPATTADSYGAGVGFSLSGLAPTLSIGSGPTISISV